MEDIKQYFILIKYLNEVKRFQLKNINKQTFLSHIQLNIFMLWLYI